MDGDQSGVIVVRAWLHDGRVIARVQATTSRRSDHEVELGVGIDSVLEIVRRWLESIEATEP